MPSLQMRTLTHATACCLIVSTGIAACRPPEAGPVIFAAAALGPPIRSLDSALAEAGTPRRYRLESSPSLEAVRKVTDLHKPADVLAVADIALLDSLVVPGFSSWYLVFGTNALVLAHGPRSLHVADLPTTSWHEILQRPGVRVGRSNPAVDPSGYRTLMAIQLAERFYRIPGLGGRLLAAMPERYVRHAEADLSALVQAGELDFIWTYRNLAKAHGLAWVELPPEVNLEDPALAAWYATATVEVPGAAGQAGLRLEGRPILFGLTIPRSAARPDLGEAFIADLLGATGRRMMAASGFHLLEAPYLVGAGAPSSISSLLARR